MSTPSCAHRLLRRLLVPVLAGALAAVGAAPGRAQERDPRAQVARRKALFIEQFTRLIEWPSGKLPADGRFVLCLIGNSETAVELAKLAAVRRFKDHAVEVRRTPTDG